MRVFVSYSPEDEDLKKKLLTHFAPAVRSGLLSLWDRSLGMITGDEPQRVVEAELSRTDVALVMLSASYLNTGGPGDEELDLIAARRARGGLRVVLILLSACGWRDEPRLQGLAVLPRNGQPIWSWPDREAALAEVYCELVALAQALGPSEREAQPMPATGSAPTAPDRAGPRADRPPAELPIRRDNRRDCEPHKAALPPPALVRIGKLPTSVAPIIGRQEELTHLDQSWDGPTRLHVVAVVALGGQGKTTLVVNWLLNSMAIADYRGAQRVFGWSFYRQGTTEDRAASADEFIAAALQCFGDPDPTKGTPFEKADRLVALVRRERSLLVLDGLEPLQYAPGASQGEGRLTDPALTSLLRELAADNPGLMVITSRARLADLEAFEGNFLHTIALLPFSESDGMALLKSLQVKGTAEELAAAVDDFKGHPLALTLLGHLLVEAWGGEVRKRSQVGPVQYADAKGGQARRAMAAYDCWFGVGPERAALRLLGLFDRPAPGDALQALRAAPIVPGLNDALGTLTDAEWNRLIARLRRAGLVEAANATDPGGVDAHPLIREHFGEALRQENEAAWREGHQRLYQWYAASTKELPDTAEELAPLFAAVLHGCRAGRHQEAFVHVFLRRIRRLTEGYSIHKLGAFGADLSALSGFFAEPWTRPVPALREAESAFVLNSVGFALHALGRLEEAVGPMRAGLASRLIQKDWQNAATAASNLSELQLALGRLNEATASARQAVELADQSGDAFQRLGKRTTLADALHQGGQTEEAGLLFVEAEAMQRERKPELPLLCSLPGYRYCDLLLLRGEIDEVLRRAEQSIEVARTNNWLLDIGLDHLSLGRAHLARLAAGHPDAAAPAFHLNQSVSRLRESGRQDYLALGLVHRAAFFRHTRDFPAASRDLDEALRLATRGHMLLHEADAHLEHARLLLAQELRDDARAALARAQALITQTGYARRAPEAAALAKQLDGK